MSSVEEPEARTAYTIGPPALTNARTVHRHRARGARGETHGFVAAVQTVTMIAAISALIYAPTWRPPWEHRGGEVDDRPVRRGVWAKTDGTSVYEPDCADATVDPANTALLLDDAGVVVARLQAAVSQRCAMVFARIVHLMQWPWHGTVEFVVTRDGKHYHLPVANELDPLYAPGVALPLHGCVGVSAEIAHTSFEVTDEASIKCVRLEAA